MSGELEAAGAAVQAGLAAGAIERKGGKYANASGACLNCDTPLVGAYCSNCGQPAHISRTLGHLVEDALHALFHFDTKAWRTLPLLAARPGTMTHAYIHGQRARYVSPLALFLFTIFVMFFVFSLVGGPDFMKDDPKIGGVSDSSSATLTVPQAQAALTEAVRKRDAAKAASVAADATAAAERATGEPGAGAGEGVEERVALGLAEGEVRRAEKNLAAAQARVTPAVRVEAAGKEVAVLEPAAAPAAQTPPPPPAAAPAEPAIGVTTPKGNVVIGGSDADDPNDKRTWQERLHDAVVSGELKINTGNEVVNEKLRHQALNPDLALYKLQQTAYKFSFLLVPISLPFIWLLFLWKRGVTLFDHVVFSLYSLSFMSLLFILLALLAKAGDWTAPLIGLSVLFVPPVHIFFHLKGTYALGWWSALWRTMFLLFFTLIALVLFAASILALGVFG